jgi:hypothetical protein
MHHIIPLTREEIALLLSVMDPESADIAAMAACTPYGDDGLAVLCLDEEERKRAFRCLRRAMSERQAVWTALSSSADKVLAEVSKRVEPGAVQADPEVLAARQAIPDVGPWTPLVRLEQFFGPYVVDRERVEETLRAKGATLYYRKRPTDAFAQLLAGPRGCFSSRNLAGRARTFARKYVARRIALATLAEGCGMGKLIFRRGQRTEWQWAPLWLRAPTERRKMRLCHPILTKAEDDALADLAA